MKLRNVKVAKRLGTKTLAGLLAFGLVVGTPSVVLADVQSTMSQSDAVQTEKLQAKSVDGRDTLTDVSDKVMDMIQKGEVKLDEESNYLIDTVTGKKVDPVTGERVEQIPANPDTPDTPDTPNTPNTPSKSEASGTSNVSGTSNAAGKHTTANNKQATDTTKKKDETKSAKSNKELIAKQKIVKLPQIKEDFRFFTVARNYAFAKTKINIREAVPENIDGSNTQTAGTDVANAKKDAEKLQKKIKTVKKDKKIKNKTVRKAKSKAVRNLQKAVEKQKKQKQKGMDAALVSQQLEEKVRTVGTLPQDGLLYILKEEENGWLYVESGDVRGFVKASEVYTDDAAQELLTVYQKKAQKKAKKDETEYNGIEGIAKTAKASVDAKDNQAYTYLRVTAGQTVAAKDTALINDQIGSAALEIKEEKNTTARTIGTMAQGQLCYILADKDSDWVYIESGDVRGFVEQKYLDFSDETKKQIEANGEDKYQTAKETVKPEENQALYYTLTSVKEGSPSGEIRESMLEFASQFIGNPYVWGGTSLTDGADCSGFVQQIYKQYGYSLPRVAEDQSQYGTKIPVEDAQPGDLIFYAKEGYVYHVVMYAGDGRTIEAASTKLGIIEGKVNTKNAVWATRILKDDYSLTGGGIEKANATEDMYGKELENFQITYYCPCEICCDKASKVTASGTPVAEGKTIATDPNVIPYGTKVIIGGHVFTAEDTGRKVQGNQISIYVNNHAEVSAFDTENTDVYLAK